MSRFVKKRANVKWAVTMQLIPSFKSTADIVWTLGMFAEVTAGMPSDCCLSLAGSVSLLFRTPHLLMLRQHLKESQRPIFGEVKPSSFTVIKLLCSLPINVSGTKNPATFVLSSYSAGAG